MSSNYTISTSYIQQDNSLFIPTGTAERYTSYIPPLPPIIGNAAQEEKKPENAAQVGKQRRKSARERLSRDAYIREYRYYKSRYLGYRDFTSLTPLEAAQRYWDIGGKDYPLDAFKASASTKERQVSTALEEGKLGRLLVECTEPIMLSLKYHHLGLPRELANPECIFSKEIIEIWRERLKILLPKNAKYHYRFEVGKENQLHVHLIINRITEGPLASITSKKVAREIYEEKGAAKYLHKPTMPWNVENLALRIEKERIRGAKKKFPRTRGTVGIPNRKRIEA